MNSTRSSRPYRSPKRTMREKARAAAAILANAQPQACGFWHSTATASTRNADPRPRVKPYVRILLAKSPEQNLCGKICSHHGAKLDENRTSTLINSTIVQSIGSVCRLVVISPAVSGDFLPLYRQAQIFARQGIALDRSTLCDWVGRACWWL